MSTDTTPTNETPAKEEVVEETPAKGEVVEETPVDDIAEGVPAMNPPETEEKSDVKEAVKSETSEEKQEIASSEVKEDAPKAKPASKSRKKKKTAAPEEKPEDKTEEYRVNLGQETASVEVAATMERLFSEEEVAALRADIQSFVRKEFKRAMVGAMKELLTEFNDV